jgi:putative transposase
MNKARVEAEDYTQFLIGSPAVFTATEAERVQPVAPKAPHHDSFTRMLNRLDPDPLPLWQEVEPLINKSDGVLILDDSTLDKPRSKHLDLVARHWSGNHHAVVRGINLITLMWSDGDRFYPTDYRIFHKSQDGLTKNDHFGNMLKSAFVRGFKPKMVLFDAWYSGSPNLKKVRSYGWKFLTRLKSNRKIRINHGDAIAVSEQPISEDGTEAWLPEFGLVKVFRVVAPNGDTSYWVTNDLEMEPMSRLMWSELSWSIEEYHRGLKQFTGVDRCQSRSSKAQRNHILCALRAFVRLEYNRFTTGISWFEAKWSIIRSAVRDYLKNPQIRLPQLASA